MSLSQRNMIIPNRFRKVKGSPRLILTLRCSSADSITAGIQSYALMKNASAVAFTGINTDAIMTRCRSFVTKLENWKRCLRPSAVILMLKKYMSCWCANGIAWIGKENFVENYGIFLDAIREQHPDADIYVQSILPVTASKEQTDPQFANSKIREYNDALLNMAQEKEYYYLNVAEAFADENGAYLKRQALPTVCILALSITRFGSNI